jgi:exonuclease VII large subunit
MADAILQLNTCVRPPDAILLTRGGAITPQEFDPFGDSLLLAVIRASRIPLFVAIGHAGDVTPALS